MTEGFWVIKSPDAVLEYTFNWENWLLPGDSVATSTWSADVGITTGTAILNGPMATVWLEGGTAGERYGVTNHIVTTAGRRDTRTLMVNCEPR